MKIESIDPCQPVSSALPTDHYHFVLSLPKNAYTQPHKQIHDLDAALRRLEILSDLLKQGYDFTQPAAKALMPQLDEAVEHLKHDTDLYRKVLIQLQLQLQTKA